MFETFHNKKEKVISLVSQVPNGKITDFGVER